MSDFLLSEKKDALTVTQLNTLVHDLFEATDIFSALAVRGEISNLVKHRSGHYYFSLKDEGSLVRALMFRGDTLKLPFELENGMNVIVYGALGTYIKDGNYRLIAHRIEPDGIGALSLAFEQLKRRLGAEGLFDAERKKRLPKIPSAIGIVTSPTGAAVRDLIHVLGRRFPFAKVILYPALVQGDGAPESLIRGIETFCQMKNVDVIIVGRGGGSAEDLWAFNSEKLARAIAAADVPVISAVGHETDFTICDFVADLRAPTPSAAAELAVPETEVLKQRFSNVIDKMYALCKKKTEALRKTVLQMSERRIFLDQNAFLMHPQKELAFYTETLMQAMRTKLAIQRTVFEKSIASLHVLNPLHVLTRGYAVVSQNGNPVRSVKEISENEEFDIRMKDGTLRAVCLERQETV